MANSRGFGSTKHWSWHGMRPNVEPSRTATPKAGDWYVAGEKKSSSSRSRKSGMGASSLQQSTAQRRWVAVAKWGRAFGAEVLVVRTKSIKETTERFGNAGAVMSTWETMRTSAATPRLRAGSGHSMSVHMAAKEWRVK